MHLGTKRLTGPQISGFFASHFSSVYKTSNSNPNNLENLSIDQYCHLPSVVTLSVDNITNGLNGLSTTRSKGPDDIAAVLLYKCRKALITLLTLLFNKSLIQKFSQQFGKLAGSHQSSNQGIPLTLLITVLFQGYHLLVRFVNSWFLRKLKNSLY